MESESKVVLSQTAETILQATSGDGSLEVRAAMQTVERPKPEDLWTTLVAETSNGSLNFTSRYSPSAERFYLQLLALPPAFSHEMLNRYHRNGFLKQADLQEVFRETVER